MAPFRNQGEGAVPWAIRETDRKVRPLDLLSTNSISSYSRNELVVGKLVDGA